MYERFYGFRERPFSLTPDPSYLYPSRVHREALSHLRYGIEGHAGFTVITGEIGCGKTTLLQTVLRSLDRKTSIARLMNTMLDSRELLEAIMLDFGLDAGHGRSKPYLIRDLAQFLVNERRAGRLALLIIDEAQNLSISALEEVRMLSNFETEKSKLIQIVLVGQPNLRDLLARHDLEQLRQRVTVTYHIEPLTAEDTHAYVNHRLRHASVGVPLTFSRPVTDVIHMHSRGVARAINVIADAILLYGYGSDKEVIDLELTNEVVADLGLWDAQTAPATEAARPVEAPRPTAAAQPAMAATSTDDADAAAGDGTSVMLVGASGIDLFASEAAASAQTRPQPAISAQERPLEMSFLSGRAELLLQAPAVPTPAPAQPAPPSRLSPGYRTLNETSFPQKPQQKSWWSRFRRGVFGEPRSAVEV
jgi:putative secretion ATPase (PEP-CTERM system associated)